MAEPKSSIAKGTVVHQVQNLDLAAGLIAVGVPLREDPPYVYARMANGQEAVIWNFCDRTSDGKEMTSDLIKAFTEDMKFIDANPQHCFTYALCALKNRAALLDHIKSDTPWVAFKGRGTGILLVKEGSKKHARCIEKGMKRVDPLKR